MTYTMNKAKEIPTPVKVVPPSQNFTSEEVKKAVLISWQNPELAKALQKLND